MMIYSCYSYIIAKTTVGVKGLKYTTWVKWITDLNVVVYRENRLKNRLSK